MVAGIKGVAFLDNARVAATSSTQGEIFVVSLATRSVLKTIDLDGVKCESLCCVPGTTKVLVADARGTLCCVDVAAEPTTMRCVASTECFANGALRVTSVVAWNERTAFVAGAERGNKTACSVHRVDLVTGTVVEAPCMLEAPMVRALYAEHGERRLLAGAINVKSDTSEGARTRIVAWAAGEDEAFDTPPQTLAELDFFVHAIAPHPRLRDTYVLLVRHTASAGCCCDTGSFDCPVRVLTLHRHDHALGSPPAVGRHTMRLAKSGIRDTLPLHQDGGISAFTSHIIGSFFGARAGREHAMAVAPDGTLITGSVDKKTKGVLQVWNLDVLDDDYDTPPPSPA